MERPNIERVLKKLENYEEQLKDDEAIPDDEGVPVKWRYYLNILANHVVYLENKIKELEYRMDQPILSDEDYNKIMNAMEEKHE